MLYSSTIKVLAVFKKLHRSRQTVFDGDERALSEARKRINDEFKKHKHVQNEGSIEEMIKLGYEVDEVLRKTVVQTTTEDNKTFSKYPFSAFCSTKWACNFSNCFISDYIFRF